MIVGIAGLYASGKGEAVRFLAQRSFYPLSLSDVIRDELHARGQAETRDLMIGTGNELRQAHGPAVLAERLISQLKSDRNYVIDSIRHPAEVEAFRSATTDFRLLWIEADEGVRMDRILSRGRPGDPTDIDQLRAQEGRELRGEEPGGQRLLEVRALADELLENSTTLESLLGALQEVLGKSLYFDRPGWDEYFMSIAQVVASRSNCVKRKVAAVITLDRRIISTGYNGTPRGVRNCNEGGCPRCNSFAPGGADLSECLCSHGEENAITQAAYHGVNVRGSTIYTTFCPCLLCTKMIINSGIVEVVFSTDYPLGDLSLALLREASVKVRQF